MKKKCDIRFINKTNNNNIKCIYLKDNKLPYNEINNKYVSIENINNIFINVNNSFNKISFNCNGIGAKVVDKVNNIEYDLPEGLSDEFLFPLGFKFPDSNYNNSYVTAINGLENYNTTNINNFEGMFESFKYAETLNLSNFDTKNATTMKYMFDWCISLKNLDLSNFNTEKCLDMGAMFSCCQSLESINLSSFNTKNVTNMSGMFNGCTLLEKLNLSNFDISRITKCNDMFKNCNSLNEIKCTRKFYDWVNINSEILSCPNNMKYSCKYIIVDEDNLEIIGLESYNTTTLSPINTTTLSVNNNTTSELTFVNLGGPPIPILVYTNEDASSYEIKRIESNSETTIECKYGYSLSSGFGSFISEIKNIEIYDTSNITNMCYMFNNCSLLISLDLSNFNTTKVTNMSYMFNNCSKLTTLKINKFIINDGTDITNMFNSCNSLSNIWLSQTLYNYFKTIQNKLPSNLINNCQYYICDENGNKINTIVGLV